MPEEQQKWLLTIEEVAQRLHVDPSTVRRWIKNGALEAIALPAIGVRQRHRVRLSTLDALLQNPQPSSFSGGHSR